MFDLKLNRTSTASAVNDAIKKLARKEVYVGIPESNAARKTGGINNAQLMYIHTNGSPLKNIPARPVIEPAIEANKAVISEQLEHAAEAALDGNEKGTDDALTRAGIAGANAAKRWFTDSRNGWPKNKPSTVRNKIRKLRGTSYQEAMDILDSGGDVSSIDTPLIDTGELRRAITSVTGDGE